MKNILKRYYWFPSHGPLARARNIFLTSIALVAFQTQVLKNAPMPSAFAEILVHPASCTTYMDSAFPREFDNSVGHVLHKMESGSAVRTVFAIRGKQRRALGALVAFLSTDSMLK
jgi:hypothetical protein